MYNSYQTISVKILDVKPEGSNSKIFTLERPRGFSAKGGPALGWDFEVGQFIIVSLPGFGEAPISICSDPNDKKNFQLGVRKAGKVSSEIHKLKVGDRIGVRGPYGHGFPLESAKKRNLLLVAGGLGLEPLRPVILEIVKNRKNYQKVQIFYGAKTESDLLFSNEYDSWLKNDIDFNLCLDNPTGKFNLKCPFIEGLVTVLFEKIPLAPDPIAFLCGPPVMYKFVLEKLAKAGFKDEDIFVSLERRMNCGVGVCQHCAIGGKYTCKHGPVFGYKDLKEYKGGYSVI